MKGALITGLAAIIIPYSICIAKQSKDLAKKTLYSDIRGLEKTLQYLDENGDKVKEEMREFINGLKAGKEACEDIRNCIYENGEPRIEESADGNVYPDCIHYLHLIAKSIKKGDAKAFNKYINAADKTVGPKVEACTAHKKWWDRHKDDSEEQKSLEERRSEDMRKRLKRMDDCNLRGENCD